MTYGERLKKARKYLRMTQSDLAKALGIKNKQTISDIENGHQKALKADKALMLQDKYGIRLAWLMHNDGPMVADRDGHTDDFVSLEYYPDIYASAGGGAYNTGVERPVSFVPNFFESAFGVNTTKGMHIINVVGDSMEPTLKNGEMIFVNPLENEGFRDGGIYVIMCGDTVLVKRVRQNPITKEYTLISDNPTVDDITLTLDESSDCRLIGRVVGHMDRI